MQNKINIMLVEDDKVLANELREFLNKWGYGCILPPDFKDIFTYYQNLRPHLILMDINLPYYDGFYWCERIREISNVPIMYISSRCDDRDKIMAIAQGGDDYIEKPFNLELFKAKIDAILRRSYEYKMKNKVFIDKNIVYDLLHQSLFYKEKEVEITKSEKKVMTALINNRGKVVQREELMMKL